MFVKIGKQTVALMNVARVEWFPPDAGAIVHLVGGDHLSVEAGPDLDRLAAVLARLEEETVGPLPAAVPGLVDPAATIAAYQAFAARCTAGTPINDAFHRLNEELASPPGRLDPSIVAARKVAAYEKFVGLVKCEASLSVRIDAVSYLRDELRKIEDASVEPAVPGYCPGAY